jgi:hypothetical protein
LARERDGEGLLAAILGLWQDIVMTDRIERRHARRIPVEIWMEAQSGDALYFHRTANLSSGGAYFDKTIPEPVGTIVQMRFTLPEGVTVTCKGKIVTAKDFAMGVQFMDLSDVDRRRIESLVEEVSGKL